MWFHVLFLSAFVALGSARGTEKPTKLSTTPEECERPGVFCPCLCKPPKICPPCPIPVPAACLENCGDTLCPCVTSRNVLKTRSSQKIVIPPLIDDVATAISTINVHPSGPVCSGFHILPHLVVTSSSCIAGKTKNELFVTVNEAVPPNLNDYNYEPLNVKNIEVYPYSSTFAEPVLLVLERPSFNVDYLLLPPVPVNPSLPGQIHRWQISEDGRIYARKKLDVTSFSQCSDGKGRDLICVRPQDEAVMGWNDIGTPFVVMDKNELFVEGIYMGKDLYNSVGEVKYLTLYPYGQWLYSMVEKYKI